MSAPGAAAQTKMPIKIPLSALAVTGEGDQAVMPAVGETIEFTTTGTVKSIEGESAVVEAQAVNGEPVTYGDEAAPTPAAEPTESDMLSMAAEADKNSML